MYRNLAEILKAIYDETPPVKNISLDEFIDEAETRIGKRPSKSTVRRILEQIGITAVEGKKRTWTSGTTDQNNK